MGATAVKINSQQVARAGEAFVSAEIHRRGGYAVTFAGNMPGIDLIASNRDHSRRVTIQVKTRRSGTWQPKESEGMPCEERSDEDRFWAFVDIGGDVPEFYIAPDWWVRNDIYETVRQVRGDAPRPRTPGSQHHAIKPSRIAQWHDRWDVLGILPEEWSTFSPPIKCGWRQGRRRR